MNCLPNWVWRRRRYTHPCVGSYFRHVLDYFIEAERARPCPSSGIAEGTTDDTEFAEGRLS